MNDLKEILKKSVKENPDMKTNEEIRIEHEKEFLGHLYSLGIYLDE